MCMFRWLRDNGKLYRAIKKSGKTVCHLIVHNSINSGVYLSALFHKKSAFSWKAETYSLSCDYRDLKLCTEVFTLLLLSRFPDLWFFALPLLLILSYNGFLWHCSPNTVTGSLRILTWFPFHRCYAVNTGALNRFMELYICIIPPAITCVKKFPYFLLSFFPLFFFWS